MGGSPSCTSGCCRDGGKQRRAFVSHCKRMDASEDRAIWVADTLDSVGIKAWFDRSDLQEITMEALREAVESSAVVVTILDPFTFESEWVVKENEWARDKEIPILLMYDGDRYQWEQVAKWQPKYPHCFKYPALQYAKNYRKESREKLISAVSDRLQAVPVSSTEEDNTDVHSGNPWPNDPSPNASDRKTPNRSTSSLGLSVDTNTGLVVAVGSSSRKDMEEAVTAASKHLLRKFSEKQTGVMPSFMIVTWSHEAVNPPDLSVIGKIFQEKFPGVPYVGGMSLGGLLADSNWLPCDFGGGKSECVVAIWGIHDPTGVYVVAHDEYPFQHDFMSLAGGISGYPDAEVVKSNETHAHKIGYEAALRAMDLARAESQEQVIESPQFVFIIPNMGYEESFIEGIGDALGADTPVLGSSSFVQMSHLKTTPCGACMALCWPSVHVAAAFCSGYLPNLACQGIITKVDHRYRMLEIDHKPARDVMLEWSGLREMWEACDCKISMPLPDAPEHVKEYWKQNLLKGQMGIEVAKDLDGEPIHRNCAVLRLSKDDTGAETMGPIEEGHRIVSMVTNKQNLQDRAAKVARQLLRNSGFSIKDVRGALLVFCGSNIACGAHMPEMCEKLAEAVGHSPAIGFSTGGEHGQHANGKSGHGNSMFCCSVFTNKRVDAVMTPGVLRKSLYTREGTMALSNQGTLLKSGAMDAELEDN